VISDSGVVFAVESSCDETAFAVVDHSGFVLAQSLHSQILTHEKYGGVVPEIASREHFFVLESLAQKVLDSLPPKTPVAAVAATLGPGLIGPLMVGSGFAQGFAAGLGVPFVGVHHLRGHLASVLLENQTSPSAHSLQSRAKSIFPGLVLLVSGGHSQVLHVQPNLSATKLLDTADDAAGECFDKCAKHMGLSYPGGPNLEKLAAAAQDLVLARQLSQSLPRPQSAEGFSFSGLKTAVRRQVDENSSRRQSPEFAWAVQDAICDSLVLGLERAWHQAQKKQGELEIKTISVCGGVAANATIRSQLQKWSADKKLELMLPPSQYATDNAAMIAAAAWLQSPELALTELVARAPL
jgi:N6-L-threonylcarbamoyladenine synthase